MPTGVFDVFEYCDVFVLSIRAMYALTMVFTGANKNWGNMVENDLAESDGFSPGPLQRLNDSTS